MACDFSIAAGFRWFKKVTMAPLSRLINIKHSMDSGIRGQRREIVIALLSLPTIEYLSRRF